MRKSYILFGIASLILVSVLILSSQQNTSTFNTFESKQTLHCLIQQYRNGKLISQSYHAMSETYYGENQTRNLLGGVNTNAMLYLGCSNDTSAFNVSWTELPSENNGTGLARALGAYQLNGDSVGSWNVTLTWNITGACSSQEYGVYSQSFAGNANSLCYAEQQGSGNLKNYLSGDTAVITVQGAA